MQVREQLHGKDSNRITKLLLEADTFEEERILTGILKAIRTGGEIETIYDAGNNEEIVMTFKFKSQEG